MARFSKLDDEKKNISQEPWSLHWAEFEAGSAEFLGLLNDPLPFFMKEFPQVDKSWRVETRIIGHEVGLTRGVVCGVPTLDSRSKTVYLMLYKH